MMAMAMMTIMRLKMMMLMMMMIINEIEIGMLNLTRSKLEKSNQQHQSLGASLSSPSPITGAVISPSPTLVSTIVMTPSLSISTEQLLLKHPQQ